MVLAICGRPSESVPRTLLPAAGMAALKSPLRYGREVAGLNGNLLESVDAGRLLPGGVRESLGGGILPLNMDGLRVARRAIDLHLRAGHVIDARNEKENVVHVANRGGGCGRPHNR